jgi:hypothetical protein
LLLLLTVVSTVEVAVAVAVVVDINCCVLLLRRDIQRYWAGGKKCMDDGV